MSHQPMSPEAFEQTPESSEFAGQEADAVAENDCQDGDR